MITLPWLLDLLGNRLDLFDTIGGWDDAMHLVNWALLTAGCAGRVRARRRQPWHDVLLALGSLGALPAGLIVSQLRRAPSAGPRSEG
ncbi:hypothetical protein [Flindersiella endophytica]